MTQSQFDLYVTALLKSIWQKDTPAPDCLGVKVEEVYEQYTKNQISLRQCISETHYELLDDCHISIESRQILSPFSFLKNSSQHFVSSFQLSLDRNFLFPTDKIDEGKSHQELLNELKNRIESLSSEEHEVNNYFRVSEMLLSMLQYYTSSVSVGTSGASLFDFARLTAAIVFCKWIDEFSSEHCLFVKADFSGIQDFIFDVISKGAAKSLKSRSLRVQLVSILTTDYLLQELQLSPANLIYNGGGNFYLLAPHTLQNDLVNHIKKIRRELINIQKDLDPDQDPLSRGLPHLETLQVYTGYTEVSFKEMRREFGQSWKKVENELKRQRLKPYHKEDWSLLFENPLPLTSQTVRREAEQSFYKKESKKINYFKGYRLKTHNGKWSERQKVSVGDHDHAFKYIRHPFSTCGRTFDLIWKEKNLKELHNEALKHILYTHTIINNPQQAIEGENGSTAEIPKPFILLVKDLPRWKEKLLNDDEIEVRVKQKKQTLKGLLDEEDDQDDHDEELIRLDQIIEFGYLSMFAEMRTGTDKLGVLKMDVDDLGKIFQTGINSDYQTLIHTSGISRSLKWFFEGYMNTLLDTPVAKGLNRLYGDEERSKLNTYQNRNSRGEVFDSELTFRDNLYVIFSGGDDFFLVGAWDIVIEFARIIHKEFKAFTQGQVTISAGFIMVDPKFPVIRFVQLVEEEGLDEAKKKPNKNSISILGQVLTWDEFDKAIEIRNTLFDLVVHKGESRAIIHKVRKSMKGYERLQSEIKRKNKISLPRLWRLAYYLRDVKKENKPQVKAEIILKYEDLLSKALQHKDQEANPALIAVGARLAEFMTKPIKSINQWENQ